MNVYATYVFQNAKGLTMNVQDDMVSTVAVAGNKIIYVGDFSGAKAYIQENTKMIDVKGRTLMPGFIDAHIHTLLYGMLGDGIINVDYNHVNSVEDMKELICQEVAKKQKGEWIILSGYDHNKLLEKRHPNRLELDEVAPENPVQCTRCCAHMGVYNSLALQKGGVLEADQFALGEVVVDADGEMTGLLKETAHMCMSAKVEFSEDAILRGLQNCSDILVSYGVTTAHDAGAYGKISTKTMERASAEGKIDVRLRPMIFDMFGKESNRAYIESFLETGIHTNLGDEKFSIGPVKIMVDGSTSGPSCATREPYSHDANLEGILVWEQNEIEEILEEAHLANFQGTAHAVGDLAVSYMLESYEHILQKYPKENHRHRIEHCALVDEGMIAQIKELQLVPISNPSFVAINADDYKRFYGERTRYMFPLASYRDNNIITAIGSDAPVTVPNPMLGVYGAINRKDLLHGTVIGENQKVDILDIIRMYTLHGAYASFEEDKKGSLEVGKLADLIILSDDILAVTEENYMQVEVALTMIDGKVVYENET